ncbi:hypothetical protein [Burkholderia cenocepacia]|uniref:hypothetical protein n=1 Tax=Burkholderia cenocepacia TaxID=95486 RepID=UPI001B92E4E6|nr:hypothetical protein [Burkholderia cenocepacia]MBR7945436.1 hypothetical protein [Burkholderia cenocepacia]
MRNAPVSDAQRMRKSRARFATVRASLGVFVHRPLLDRTKERLASIRAQAQALKDDDSLTPKQREATRLVAAAGLMHLVGAALEHFERQQEGKQAELMRQYMTTLAAAERGAEPNVEPTPVAGPVEPTAPITLDALGDFIVPVGSAE